MQLSLETKARILIVDDEKLNIAVLAESLRDDYRVSIASNGADALRIARTAPYPDLILLDVNMPAMSGFEVCAQLQADPATAAIPVIFVTAQGDRLSEARGLGQGAVDYIHKPVEPALVRLRVALHLRLKLQAEFLQRLLERQTVDLEEAREQARQLLDFVRGSPPAA